MFQVEIKKDGQSVFSEIYEEVEISTHRPVVGIITKGEDKVHELVPSCFEQIKIIGTKMNLSPEVKNYVYLRKFEKNEKCHIK